MGLKIANYVQYFITAFMLGGGVGLLIQGRLIGLFPLLVSPVCLLMAAKTNDMIREIEAINRK